MLVLHPNSQCDVCLDGYYSTKEPLVINCGHIFCQRCLQSLPRPLCPLCRLEFKPADVRRLHVDKTALPPSTPASIATDLDKASAQARRLQAGITRVVLEGASVAEVRDLLGDAHNWLGSQPSSEYDDLRAAYRLLYRYTNVQNKHVEDKRRLADVEQTCSDLKEQVEDLENEREELTTKLQEERDHAAVKYEELEQKSFEERELLLEAERKLQEETDQLREERDHWKTKCDGVDAECQRLREEIDKVKRNPPTSRTAELRYFYLHDQKGGKAEPLAILKEDGRDASTFKVQIVGKDNVFHLSPVPTTQPIPEISSTMMAFLPLTDEPDDCTDDEKPHPGSNGISSASRSIPIKPRSGSYRDHSRSNSLLTRPDSDAMSVSAPRSNLDVHMASCSTSPTSSVSQHGPRPSPPEYVSSSYRVPDNMLGLRADPQRASPPAVDPALKEQQERERQRNQVAQLREVLQDPSSGRSPRKPSVSDGSMRERERARAAVPSTVSSTRTPSPVSSSSYGYSGEREYSPPPYRSQHLAPQSGISSASHAAAERERARASSVNSQNAPSAPIPPPSAPLTQHLAPAISSTSLSHVTVTRDRETSTPVYPVYGPPLHMQGHLVGRPSQTRRQSIDNHQATMANLSGSISKGKAAAMNMGPPPQYTSNLTRSIRAMQEAPRVS